MWSPGKFSRYDICKSITYKNQNKRESSFHYNKIATNRRLFFICNINALLYNFPWKQWIKRYLMETKT